VIQSQVTTDWFVQPAENILAQIPKRMAKKSSQLKVALVCSNDAYGQSNCAAQKKYILGNMKADLVLEQYYDRFATDFSSLVQRLQAANPDVVAATGYTDDVVLMWQQAKQVGYKPKYFVGSGGAATTNFVDALGSWANGFMTYSYMLPNKGNAKSMAFAKKYLATYHEPVPSGHALMTYGQLFKLADVLRMTKGNDNPDTVLAAANKLVKKQNSYPDGCGFKLFHNRNAWCATVGMQWQNGKLVTIWPKAAATAKMVGPMPVG
jgi:branched-chain amino acid transport system substrate-binding protein